MPRNDLRRDHGTARGDGARGRPVCAGRIHGHGGERGRAGDRAVDLVVASDEDNVERLRAALRSVFDDPSIDEIDAGELSCAYPVVQYFPPGQRDSVDIIARLGEAYAFDDIEWHWMDVEGLRIKVATPRILYAMKRDTVREQDRLDARMLRERFGDEVD